MTARRRELRERRQRRVRRKVAGTPERPRLAVYRSERHIYAQIIDDAAGHTLACASTVDTGLRSEHPRGATVDAARAVGRLLGERAREKGIEAVVFDRGGFRYQGRVAGVAEGAREAGLEF